MSARVFDHLVNAYNGDDKRKQEIRLYQHAKDSLFSRQMRGVNRAGIEFLLFPDRENSSV